ncbi:MASE1 domain-containing protein [Rhodanobacter sp. Col0626]|uniref:MASE1 domain-containing protein n=1 Tax=Rhodanobacter sp. Col0626 TaxID=3415679 RepID=UPI003CF16D33
MSQGSRWNVGTRHAAVALSYALGFLLLREVSWSHWVVFAGYRLSVLMLVPYRYWPALLVGEMGPVAYASLSCVETFGWLWSSLMLVPPMGMAMPIVKYCRDRLGMVPQHGPARLPVVMGCALAVSAIWTLAYTLTLSTAQVPAGFPPIQYGIEAARWFIGNYLGVLTVAPLVLLIWKGRAKRPALWRPTIERALANPLAIETAAFVLPVLALLVWFGTEASGDTAQAVARMLMFAPVVWLALRHGWPGAAIGGTAASVAVALTMPELYDASTLKAEVFVAFAVSSMLLFGSRLSVQVWRRTKGDEPSQHSLDLARRIQAQCEAQLQQSAWCIELVSETVQATEELLFDRLRQHRPTVDTRELRRRTTVTREQMFQLADSMNPVTLREHGLEAALRRGGIARGLNSHRVGYWCQVKGSLQHLSQPLQLALYRLACEGVCLQCTQNSVRDITVHLRAGQRSGHQWVFIRIDALFSHDPTAREQGLSMLNRRLAATGLGMNAIRDCATLYEGTVRVRTTVHGQNIGVFVREPMAAGWERAAPVERANPLVLNWN